MFKVPLVTSSHLVPVENFWNSVYLYHEMPHVVNRKLGAVTQIGFYKVIVHSKGFDKVADLFRREALIYETRKVNLSNFDCQQFLKNILEPHKVEIFEYNLEDSKYSLGDVFISMRLLLGRRDGLKCPEIVIFDKSENIASFIAVQEQNQTSLAPVFPYHIELNSGNLRIFVDKFEDADTSNAEWLADNLFDKLVKWAANCDEDKNILRSLSLVPSDAYFNTYHELKNKYSKDLVKKWPEKTTTDPQKYIHEDIAIAAYLISFWRHRKTENINFVDCGCGNGLLVYILNQEGFHGYGVDVRSRKTWEIYGDKADLRVHTITPASKFQDSTWLIGNHSDELTPWIPVMSVLNSAETNFFMLPCCPYDLTGRKFIRMNTKLSQYSDYMNYVKGLSEKAGFQTEMDKLRIPSTKRTCIIGIRNKTTPQDFLKIQCDLQSYVEDTMKGVDLVVRKATEPVRNCTKIDRNLIGKLVNLIVANLLQTENLKLKSDNQGVWNKGGELHISELSKIIPREDLLEIKSQCGGLQTLIKNHRYIFNYINGIVTLKEPLVKNEATEKYKDKPCWFLKNHPHGCLNSDGICACKHE